MTDPRAAVVRWVVDREDRLATCVQINALHDLAGGVIVVHRRPGSRGLAHDLLGALGKHRHGLGWPTEPRAWPLADLWVIAESVDHIVVYGAHRLTADDLDRLTQTAVRARARLWLVTRIFGQAEHDHRAELSELLAIAAPDARPYTLQEHIDERSATFCVDEDFVSFRTGCWRALGVGALRDVEEHLASVIDQVTRWLARHPDGNRWQAGALLEQLLSNARDQDEVIIVLRAMQLAYFRHGQLLDCDTRALCDASRLIINPRRGDEQAAALRGISAPDLVALGALTVCTPLDSHRLAALRVESIDDHGAHVTSGDSRYALPAAFRGLVCAQKLSRQRAATQPSDALFVDAVGGACAPHRIRELARSAREDCLAGREPRHVDDTAGRHLGGLLRIRSLRRARHDDVPGRVPAG